MPLQGLRIFTQVQDIFAKFLRLYHFWQRERGVIGAFRDSRYDVIFAHAQITGRQCSGQHNGRIYGMHANLVEIMPFGIFIAVDVCFNSNIFSFS